jgi:acetyltransferase-like isoleucine patch superfamily enzyme
MKENLYKLNIKKRSTLHFIIGVFPRFYKYFLNSVVLSVSKFNGAKIGKNTSITLALALKSNKNLIIGDYTIIETSNIDLREKITIGNKVIINKGVIILRQSHDLNSSIFKTIGNELEIEDFVWITSNSIITPSCKIINSSAVIAVGSIVVKDVESNVIVGGNPAKFIKIRPNVPYDLEFDSFQGRDFLKYIKARFK